MTNFRSYQLSKELYQQVKTLPLKGNLKDQINRASSSICLNLAEGNDRLTTRDRLKFFNIALTSLREVQAIADIEELTHIASLSDQLAASLWNLCRSLERSLHSRKTEYGVRNTESG